MVSGIVMVTAILKCGLRRGTDIDQSLLSLCEGVVSAYRYARIVPLCTLRILATPVFPLINEV